jgi:hypothetical protein
VKVWSPAAGREIEVEEVQSNATAKGPPKSQFRAQWVKLPATWITTLRQTKSASTKQMAMEILHAEFRRKHTGGQIVLSAATTGMHHTTRNRAAGELVRLGLIELEGEGKQAMRVARIHA